MEKHSALSSRSKFCKLIAKAREYRLEGCWYGSAYRSHPCGVYREGLLFTNHWNIDNACDIRAATVPTATLFLGCQDPRVYGDPYPKPSAGEFIVVWNNGRWLIEGPWQEKASRILYEIEAEIKQQEEKYKEEKEHQQQRARNEYLAKIKALRAAHSI